MERRLPALLVVLSAGLAVVMARPALAAGPTDDAQSEQQWGLADVKAPQAWGRGRGAGVTIAVVSTGIANHEDLMAKVDAGFSVIVGSATADSSGRGTHLAGIAAAATDNRIGIAGVAPDARLIPAKAFEGDSTDGNGHISALDRLRTTKPAVVLVDIPGSFPANKREPLRQSLRALGDAGVSVVVGAREGLTLDDLPVLAVAATTRTGTQAPGTAGVGTRGVAGPGQDILSTTKVNQLLVTTDGYGTRSGTGQAAAHVAGAVAILRGIGANATQAADLLRSTARTSGSGSFGAGMIDIAAAATAFQTAPPPPGPTTTTTTKKGATTPTTGGRPTGPASGTATTLVPPGQVVPVGPAFDAPLPTTEPAELGDTEEAFIPPGAEAFADDPGAGAAVLTVEGTERPWGVLTVGFGLLFGMGTALSLTFRRMANAPL